MVISDQHLLKYKNNQDLSQLVEVFKKFPDIRAVYLFGSAVKKRIHLESDLDLAVVPGDRHCRERKLDMLRDLAENGFCNVDLVFLDGDDIVLKFEAVRGAALVYAREDFRSGSYYSEIVRKYFDFRYYLDVHRNAYKARMLHGPA